MLAAALVGTAGLDGVASAHASARGSCLAELDRAAAVPQRVAAIWATNDARRFAREFTREGNLVNSRGALFDRRRAIRRNFATAFDTYLRGTRPEFTVLRARCLSRHSALVHTTGRLLSEGQTEPGEPMIQTWLLRQDGHRWRIASLHTTTINPGGPDPRGPGAPAPAAGRARVAGWTGLSRREPRRRGHRSCRTDIDAIRALVRQRTPDAWKTGDPAAFSRLITPDGVFIVGDGTLLIGRAELERYMVEVFKAVPGVTTMGSITDVDCVERTVAVVHTQAGLLLPGETEVPPERLGTQSYVVTRFGDEWLMAAYQNTRIARR